VSALAELDLTTVHLPGRGIDIPVYRGGRGPTIVVLHGPYGTAASDPLPLALASDFDVVAPLCPGFRDLDDIDEIRDVHDLAFCYDELLDALGLDGATVVGHSFGGMIAAEVAAHVPSRVARLVLAAPFGLWRTDQPTNDFFTAFPLGLQELLWADPAGSAAQETVAALSAAEPDVEDPTVAALLGMVRGMATMGKYLWPLPDKGLERRLHRVRALTVVVWGEKDLIVPTAHADLFAAAITGARVEIMDGAGHMAPHEDRDRFLAVVSEAARA